MRDENGAVIPYDRGLLGAVASRALPFCDNPHRASDRTHQRTIGASHWKCLAAADVVVVLFVALVGGAFAPWNPRSLMGLSL